MKDSDWLRDRRSLSESPVVCKARVGQRWSRAQAARLASRWSPFQGFHVRKERKRQSRQPINDSASADPAYHTRLLRLFPGWLGADPTPRPFSIQGTGSIGANGNPLAEQMEWCGMRDYWDLLLSSGTPARTPHVLVFVSWSRPC